MNWSQLTNGVRQICDDRPDLVALLLIGGFVFAFIVLDARRCRHRKNKDARRY